MGVGEIEAAHIDMVSEHIRDIRQVVMDIVIIDIRQVFHTFRCCFIAVL